ncbi:MAG: hypothetical protein NT011_08155 [Kiritimatiellaeota bacterium]|nr:hypothetical protein [Kiritimatiellota bacterium]
MPKQTMTRKASDNVYLHKDFHGALSNGIEYIHEKYGAEAVRDYLRQFAGTYYAPLKEDLIRRGLIALKEHYDKIFKAEGGKVRFTLSDCELQIEVETNPAVQHLRAQKIPVARLFSETIRTVGEELCAGTPFAVELLAYDEASGRYAQRFYRKA